MDNFMDKIAKKLNSQEVIRANAAADTAQLEGLQSQVAEYDACMKEMRKLNLKNVESEQKFHKLMEESSSEFKELARKNEEQMQQLMQECLTKLQSTEKEEEKEELLKKVEAAFTENRSNVEELFKQAEDFVHKENVKVYRNVQAVVVEEMQKQSQALLNFGQSSAGKGKGGVIIGIATLAVSVINMIVLLMHLGGWF